MTAINYNPMIAFRRFVGLRSAWRRSLAMEPHAPATGCPAARQSQGNASAPRSDCCASACRT